MQELSDGAGHTTFGNPFITDYRDVFWDTKEGTLFDLGDKGPMRVPQRDL